MYDTIGNELNQGFGVDPDPLKINDMNYRQRKLDTQKVAAAYMLIRERQPQEVRTDKAFRMRDCSNFLLISPGEDGQARVKKTNACRIRLCPWCSYRRSIKAYHINAKVYKHLVETTNNKDWVLLTLTIRNMPGDGLGAGIDDLLKGIKVMQRQKRIKKAWAGSIRQLEVSYNSETNTYHPHIHMLVNVGPCYWTKDYISKDDYMNYWANSMGLDYSPVVDVRKVSEPERAVAEISKYATKYADILCLDVERLAGVVDILDEALHGRKLISYAGTAREAKRALLLPDPERIDGTEDDNVLPKTVEEILYRWHWKSKKYVVDYTYKKNPGE